MKSKLSIGLINNAYDFYNKNLEEAFLDIEYQNLSSKLQEMIEHDHIIKNKKLPYDLPQYTLCIIYFIGEYKKAYQYAQQDKQNKDKNTLESLGKGFANKEKEYEKGLKKVLDESIDIDDRLKEFFKTLILLLEIYTPGVESRHNNLFNEKREATFRLIVIISKYYSFI